MSARFSSGAKSSEQKPRYDLIPLEAQTREAIRMGEGAAAHGENNYRTGKDDPQFVKDRINHLIEHALKYASGDRSEDHLAAIRCNTGMLMWIEAHRGPDVRPGIFVAGHSGSIFVQGRAHCPTCQRVETVVRHPDVTEVRCPRCDGLAILRANGDEV